MLLVAGCAQTRLLAPSRANSGLVRSRNLCHQSQRTRRRLVTVASAACADARPSWWDVGQSENDSNGSNKELSHILSRVWGLVSHEGKLLGMSVFFMVSTSIPGAACIPRWCPCCAASVHTGERGHAPCHAKRLPHHPLLPPPPPAITPAGSGSTVRARHPTFHCQNTVFGDQWRGA